MAKITPIDIIKGVSIKFGGGNSKEYFVTNKCSYHIHLAKRVNSSVQVPLILRSSSVHPPFNLRSTSVRAPFNLRSTSVQPPFNLRSTSVQPPFILRSSSVQAPFELRLSFVLFSISSRSVLDRSSIDSRSSFVHPPFILRSSIEDRSKNNRRNIGESSEARRRCNETLMGNQGKGNPNKKTPKIPHKSHAPDFQKKL